MPAVLIAGPTATQYSLFFHSGGRTHRQYSLHGPTERWPGWVRLEKTGIIDPPKVVTNPSSNRVQRSITKLMRPMPLPLCLPLCRTSQLMGSHVYWPGSYNKLGKATHPSTGIPSLTDPCAQRLEHTSPQSDLTWRMCHYVILYIWSNEEKN